MFGNNKPFGTSSAFGTSTFGSTTTPFGQNTSGFGTKPLGSNVFGTSFGTTAPSGSTGGSIFGTSAPNTGTSVFGQPTSTFGQPVSTGNTAFGFGSTSTAGGLFGSTQQQNTSSGIFGNTASPAFGTSRSSFGNFGNTSGGSTLFGTSQTQHTSGLFGQNATAGTGLFGSSGGFGSNTTGTTIKFNPPTGTDTMMKNGVSTNINTRHQCITCMKEYENKSLEELRVEDYVANRKGPQGGNIGAFGSTGQTSLFGTPASTSTFSFGSTQNKPLFGGTSTSSFGSTSSGLFGQNTQQQNNSLFGKPVGFGVPTSSSSSSFNFGTGGGTSLFGQTNQQKSLFGQPTSSGLFGTTTTTQPSTAFGTGNTFGTPFGNPSQPSTGLFGNKPAGFGTTGTTTSTSTFNFGSATSNTGTGLFGQKPTGTAFGTSATFGSATPSFGGFGGTQPGTGTGLFGQNKSATGFNTGSGTTFGTNLGSSFGTSFAPSLGATNTGTSLFGSTAVSKPTGFSFGNNPSTGFSFGQPGLNVGSFGFGSNLTSNITNDPNAAAYTQQQLQTQQQILALTTNPFGDSPLFRNIIKDNNKREEILKPTNPAAQKAVMASNQYKVSPGPIGKIKPKPIQAVAVGKVSLFDDLDDSEINLETFIPRRSVKKLQLQPKTTDIIDISSNTQEHNEITETNLTPGDKNKSPITIQLSTDTINRCKQQNSVEPSNKENTKSNQETTTINEYYINPVAKPVAEHACFKNSAVLDDTIAALHTKSQNAKNSDRALGLTNCSENDDSERETSNILTSENDESHDIYDTQSCHPAGIVLRRTGYYTIPPLQELATMVDENGNCIVENFTIGREGYGNVFFPGETNVAGLNLDEIVHFRRKEITIYPDDDNKPPVGEGLNRQAQITLDCVWPVDKTTHEPIKVAERLKQMGYEEKIERATLKLGAKFMEYRPETGSWVFQVNHFSKYGLEDSDDETEYVATSETQKTSQTKAKQISSLPDQKMDVQMAKKIGNDDDDDEMEDVTGQTFSRDLIEDESNVDLLHPTSHHLLQATGVSLSRIQGMKATLFDEEMENECDIVDVKIAERNDFILNIESIKSPNKKLAIEDKILSKVMTTPEIRYSRLHQTTDNSSAPTLPELLSDHPILISGISSKSIKCTQGHVWKGGTKVKLLPWPQSLLHNNQRMIADAGCSNGRSFRSGWGPSWKLVHLGNSLKTVSRLNSQHILLSSPFTSSNAEFPQLNLVIENINMSSLLQHTDNIIKTNLEELLNVHLSHSTYTVENGAPIFVAKPGIDLLHATADSSRNHVLNMDPSHSDADIIRQCHHVWELCIALWGNIPGYDKGTESSNSYAQLIARREAFSKWLIETTSNQIQQDIRNNKIYGNGYLSTIFTFLTGHQIVEACNVSHHSDDNRLSLLIAQASCNMISRKLIQKQLEIWEQLKSDNYINVTRLKIFALLAGTLTWQASNVSINCCDNLDWKRALSIHFWYHCPSNAGLNEVVTEYEKAFQGLTPAGRYAQPPFPPYIENNPILLAETLTDINNGVNNVPYDTSYHLLKLYCNRSYRMDKLLNPITSTPSHLDYRLSWLLLQVLQALGYENVPIQLIDTLHCNFSSQLESLGLWHWAVFVALHISDIMRRQALVMDLLYRCISLDLTEEDTAVENFLIERLRIPKHWIFLAKAVKARYLNKSNEEAWYLLKAGYWNKSHEIIINNLAADAIISERYDYLKEYLEQLAYPERSITILDWNIGGQVFLDYIQITQTMEKVIKDEISAYDLEKLQPEVLSLCLRLSSLRCLNAKDRLCQSEMAKKTATLLRAVLMLQTAKSKETDHPPIHLLAPNLSKLPMPEDYTLQELQTMTHSYIISIAKSN